MTALAEAYYRRLYAFHDDSPVIPLEEFYNPNHDPKDGKFTNGPGGRIGTGGKGGKVWTGVSADPDNRVKPKSKVHFPIEPDDFETPGEARARFASSIYDADLGDGYQARVVGARFIPPNGIAVTIKIRKGHEEVANSTRELAHDGAGRLVAHHETLYVNPKHQGKGIADRFNAHAVAEYQKLGVDRIDLHAGDKVGGYAWARQGYRIFEGDRKRFIGAQLDRLDAQMKHPAPVLRPHAKKIKADVTALRKALEAGEDVQPIHLAAIGEKYARHTARDDHRREYPTWPGKSLLIGTTWLGQYYFDANRAVTAAATDLEHAALRPAFRSVVEEFFNKNHDKAGRFSSGSGSAGSVSAGPRAPKQAHLSRDETRAAPNTTEFGKRINAMLDKDPNLRDLSKKTIDAAHEKRLAGQRAIDEDELVRTYTVGTPLIESSHTYRGRWWLDQPGNKEQGERENAAIDEMASALARVKQIRQEDYEPQNQSERILQNAMDKRLHHEDIYEPLILNGDYGQIVLRGARVRNLQKDVVVDGVMEQAVIRVGHEVRIEIRDRVAKLDVDAVETHHIDTMSKINALAKEVYGDEAQVSISRFRSDTEANINVSGPAEKEGRFRQNLDKDHPAMVKIRALVNDSGINTHRQADHVANFQNREHQRITHEVLSEITQLGGRLDGTPKNVKNRWGSINSHDQVVAAVKNYPDSWVGASNASTTLKFRQTSGRAHYQHSKNDGKSEITLDGSIATAVHEFAHRFERTVPGVLGLEARFHDRRTAGEKEVKMGAGYGRNEVTKPDQFFERYAGKTYHGNAYELMSMGYEHLRSSTGWGRVDDEYKAFVLGTLVSAYRG